jgi:mono/diheme cytochrome c family protein
MFSFSRVLVTLAIILPVAAQGPTYGIGRAPTPDEVKSWDIAISPDGKELPPGSGTAAEGSRIYAANCASCHGKTGKEGPSEALVGGQGTLGTPKPVRTIGSFWPYATTVWDYINRSMPYNKPGSLTANEVYAVTAYLLTLNGIIKNEDVMDAKSLPKVKMPNRDGFIGDPRPDWKKP